MARDAGIGYISVEKSGQVEPTHRLKLGSGITLSKDDDDAVEINASLSVSQLDDIGDVNAPSPSDEEFLVWDDDTGKWRPRTIEAGDVEAGDLPAHSHGKADLPAAVAYEDEANTFTENQRVSGAQIAGTVYNLGTVGGGSTSVNWSNGNEQKASLSAAQTINLAGSNVKAGVTYTLWIESNGYAVTWQGVNWGSKGAPSLSSSGWDVIQIKFLVDGGANGAGSYDCSGYTVTE
jgi:hypothetical protein